MKRRDLEKYLEQNGFHFLRDSGHCIYTNGSVNIAIPHHKDINIFLAKKIMKQVLNAKSVRSAA